MEFMPALPTSGPLGKKENYEPTNRDLYNNALKQNGVINELSDSTKELNDKVQALATTVASHTEVIDKLSQIKSVIMWLLLFVGVGGLSSLLTFVKTWLTH